LKATDDAFAKLLGRQPSDAERERLYRARDALGIRENDAFWYIIMLLEHYDALYASYPARMAAAADDAVAKARGAFEAAALAETAAARRLLAEEVKRVAAKSAGGLENRLGVIGAVLAAVVVFGAVCMSAGAALGVGGGRVLAGAGSGLGWRVVSWALRMPAGWMAFALLVPGLLQLGRVGVRSAKIGATPEERAGGWGLVAVSALGGLACAVVLVCVGAGR
jgi:hypothetical protein